MSALPLILLCFRGWSFEQSSSPVTPNLKQSLFDRGQKNEFDVFTAFGFKPLGEIRESLGGAATSNEFAFSHPTFPVAGVLTQTQTNK
ncbi:hypothetical protein N9L06_06355, partial [Mariniblastus sp.]|nr:hypothetical protein [Mariniblastus sp.]